MAKTDEMRKAALELAREVERQARELVKHEGPQIKDAAVQLAHELLKETHKLVRQEGPRVRRVAADLAKEMRAGIKKSR